MKRITAFSFVIGIVLLASSAAAYAQTAHTPKLNSKEEKDVVSALELQIAADGRSDAVVNAAFLRVAGTWAYLQGLPKRNLTEEQFENNVKALLRKSRGKWTVVRYLVGSHDLAYLGWRSEFGAPKTIFPKAVRSSL